MALHASSQGAQRLRRLLDIERTLANQAPDWDTLVRRCRAWRVAFPVGVLLNASKETLGAEVPDEVVQELAGRPLERLLAHQLTGWAPSGRLPGGRSVKTGLSRSLRDSLFATSVQFGSESWRVLGSVVKTKPVVKTEPTKGPMRATAVTQATCPATSASWRWSTPSDRFGHLSNREYRRLRLRHDDRAE